MMAHRLQLELHDPIFIEKVYKLLPTHFDRSIFNLPLSENGFGFKTMIDFESTP